MNCLCCGKPITSDNTSEISNGWHTKCIKKFFGTKEMPKIEITNELLQEYAKDSTDKGYTVPGVQKKISLYLSKDSGQPPRLTLLNYPAGYILKPQTDEYKSLPEAEYLAMHMAEEVGIKTVPYALIKLNDESIAYISKRIDRKETNNSIGIYAMEDFCQLAGRLTEDKYKGSYEKCAKIINDYSSQSRLDMTELFIRIIFSFVIGNSDMHLKNFSLIETDEGNCKYILSKAYDLLPVNTVNPSDTEQFALTLNGKKRNLRKNDFLKFADSCGIDKKVAERLIEKVIKCKDNLINECKLSYLDDDMKTNLINLIETRVAALE